jgi:hypothetical protein
LTSSDEIIKQVETTLRDTAYPPTLKEKEILTTILFHISAGNPEFGRYR